MLATTDLKNENTDWVRKNFDTALEYQTRIMLGMKIERWIAEIKPPHSASSTLSLSPLNAIIGSSRGWKLLFKNITRTLSSLFSRSYVCYFRRYVDRNTINKHKYLDLKITTSILEEKDSLELSQIELKPIDFLMVFRLPLSCTPFFVARRKDKSERLVNWTKVSEREHHQNIKYQAIILSNIFIHPKL